VQLPAGLSAKDLLQTAPYNAQNPQTNHVCAGPTLKLQQCVCSRGAIAC